jgi:hypothetical protein
MKTLFLILGIAALFITAGARAVGYSDQDRDFSLPGLSPYQSENVYRGDQSDGSRCPVTSDGSTSGECRSGGSIDTPG